MYDVLFTFQSLTAAQRGQSVCRHHGISAAVIRAPVGLSANGCGFALRVSGEYAGQVSMVLRLESIRFTGAYRLNGNRAEEVAL